MRSARDSLDTSSIPAIGAISLKVNGNPIAGVASGPFWTFVFGLDAGINTLTFDSGLTTSTGDFQATISAIPLPASVWLFISGIGALAVIVRRRRNPITVATA